MPKIDHNAEADKLVKRTANLLSQAVDDGVLNEVDELRPILDLFSRAVAHRCVAIVKESKRDK